MADLDVRRHPDRTSFDLEIGTTYVAMGIGFWDGIVWAEIAVEGDFLLSIPLDQFEVVVGRPSIHWELRNGQDGAVRMWPPSFFDRGYHSRLADQVPEVVRDFAKVRDMLEREDQRLEGIVSVEP